MRDREVMFAAWQDIDFEKGLFKVTEKPDVGFKINDKEECLIPIASLLLAELKRRYRERTHETWIFPTERGLPDGHMLRRLQDLGLRAGLNCGLCLTRNGFLPRSCLLQAARTAQIQADLCHHAP